MSQSVLARHRQIHEVPIRHCDHHRPERAQSEVSALRMIRLALDGITSFSTRSLRYVTFMGLGVALIAFVLMLYSLVSWAQGATVSGWTSIMMIILFLGAFQLIALGIIGEYLGKVFLETKRRPPTSSTKSWASNDRADRGFDPGLPGPAICGEPHLPLLICPITLRAAYRALMGRWRTTTTTR